MINKKASAIAILSIVIISIAILGTIGYFFLHSNESENTENNDETNTIANAEDVKCTPNHSLALRDVKNEIEINGKITELYASEIVGHGNRIKVTIDGKEYESGQNQILVLENGKIIKFGNIYGSSAVAIGIYYCIEK